MNLITLVSLLALSAFPSATPSSWMYPESFHLELGSERSSIEKEFEARNWALEEGKGYEELVHEYDEGRTLSLSFLDDRLTSIRFELATFPPTSREAFDELRNELTLRYGDAKELGSERALAFSDGELSVHLVLLDRFDGDPGSAPVEVVVTRFFRRR